MRISTETLWKQNKSQIEKTCQNISFQTGHDYKDLLDESNAIFWLTLNSFDCSSRFSTWLISQLRYRLWNHVYRKTKSTEPLEEDINIFSTNDYDYIDMISSLSEESKMIVSAILNPPEELIDLISRKDKKKGTIRGLTKSLLREYLIRIGWSVNSIKECFQEITECLKIEVDGD